MSTAQDTVILLNITDRFYVSKANNNNNLYIKITFIPRAAKCVRSEKSPAWGRWYDNVLLGEGYNTPHGALTDDQVRKTS
jgi:hypothetical protein